MSSKPMNPRTARTPRENEQSYIIAHGAPKHYVDGYGLVGGGKVVTLPPGVTPGKWMVELAPEDAVKARASESDSQRLAVLGAAKIKVKANSDDVKRKELADEAAQASNMAKLQASAQAEADAIKRAADAEAKVKKADDELAAQKTKANDLAVELDTTRRDLAAVQAQLAKYEQANGTAKEAPSKK